MKHSIVTITPQMAQMMLESNTANRKLDDRIVAQYARDMSNGSWKINGETIKFSSTGKLLDGQHRLHASVRSGHDLVTMMVEGLEDDTFTTIDVGKKRTAGQILSIAGYANTARLASVVRYINIVERKILRPTLGGSAIGMTSQQIMEWIEAHTFVIEAIKEGEKLGKICSKAVASAAYYLMYLRDPELAHRYFVGLFTGENLKAGEPALVVRNRLIGLTGTEKKSLEQLAIIIRGWNALRNGEEVSAVRGFVKNKSGEYNSVEIE
jgi:hypothetical protein